MDNKSKKPPKGNVKFNITLSDEQKLAKENIMKHAFSFVVGKAGSGKTLLAVQVALDMFFKRQYNKIIITRPTVATEDNGFLPGTEKEKLEPWLVPIMSNMRKVYNKPEKIKTMALGRLGRNSIMIFCGVNQQIDLKDSFNSAIDEISKLKDSPHVYKIVLEDNHRHKAINDVLKLLTGY